jgi:MtN3 and saliva related transmembrane protein
MLTDEEIEIFGYIAGVLLIISFIPQIVKIIILKSAKEISWWFILVQLLVNALFITYGVLLEAKAIYIPSCILTIEKILILVLKYYFDRTSSVKTEEIKLDIIKLNDNSNNVKLNDNSNKMDDVTIEMDSQFKISTMKIEKLLTGDVNVKM